MITKELQSETQEPEDEFSAEWIDEDYWKHLRDFIETDANGNCFSDADPGL
jgi:hypothetical protein